MQISDYYHISKNASEGNDNFKKGAIGAFGYGFVFCDLQDIDFKKELDQESFQLMCVRDPLDFVRTAESWDSAEISALLSKELYEDMTISSKVKTLVPTVKYGGDECLFEVILFTLTPLKHFFPLSFYYGPSGLALGRFNIDWRNKSIETIFNFNPFSYREQEKEALAKSLLAALQKVPTSDFYGVYEHDLGHTFMAMKRGKPISMEVTNIDPSYLAFLYDFI